MQIIDRSEFDPHWVDIRLSLVNTFKKRTHLKRRNGLSTDLPFLDHNSEYTGRYRLLHCLGPERLHDLQCSYQHIHLDDVEYLFVKEAKKKKKKEREFS